MAQLKRIVTSRVIAVWILIIAVVAGATYLFVSSAAAESHPNALDYRHRSEVAVALTDTGFEPLSITVSKGTKITFTTSRGEPFWPASDPHPQHTLHPFFDPQRDLAASETWSIAFPDPGIYEYHDHIRSYFHGIIYVQ